jgi:tetratricopeptide (TPR) repeat protein
LTETPQLTRKLRTAAMLFAVLALTFLAYVTTFQFKFVYDDESQIVANPLIQQWRYVPYYFGIHVWAFSYPNLAGNYYRPIFLLWLRLNDALFGLKPFGWHLTTVLMHVLATFLVFKLARRLSQRDDLALIAALIFGLHPVHVEPVSWVAGVSESLLAVLLITSFLFYLDWREDKPNTRTYSLLFFALAMFSKETAVLMPPLVFAYEWLQRSETPIIGRFWKSLRPAIPYVGITLIYLYLRSIVLHGLFHRIYTLSRVTNLMTLPSVLWFDVKLLVAPIGLSGFYDLGYVTAPTFKNFVLPLIGVLVAAFGLFYWWWKTRDRLVAFAAVLLILPLLPLMNLSVFVEGEIVHDRYLYLPSIGFALLVAIALSNIPSSESPESIRRPGFMIAAAISIVFLVMTVSQSLYWANNLVLYYRGVAIAPNNNLARNNLANEFEKRGMIPQAISLYEQVLQREPNFWLANYNLGYLFYKNQECQKSVYFLERAAALNPIDGDAMYYLGQCEFNLGHLDLAELALHRSIANDSRILGTRYWLGMVLKKQGRNQEALDYFRAELAKDPNDAKAQMEVESLTK